LAVFALLFGGAAREGGHVNAPYGAGQAEFVALQQSEAA